MNPPLNCDDLIELIPAYSLGATDAEETDRVEASLKACPEAQQALLEYQALQAELALALPQVQPPEGLLADLLVQVDQSRAWAAPRRLGWLAVACLTLLLLASNVFWALQAADSSSLELLVLPAAANGRGSSASAQVIWAPSVREGVILATNFPTQAQDTVYQAWVTRGEQIISLGTFRVDEQGRGALLFAAQELVTAFDALGVTLEPGGGSPRPTSGPIVRWQNS
jgi:anti-sigma factor RsiW